MSSTGLSPIQQAAYTLLTADTQFMALAKALFDYVPDKQAYPYVTIGETVETPFRVFGNNGHEDVLTLHIWSRPPRRGFQEAFAILDRMTAVLEAGPLVVAGHATVLVNAEDTNAMLDPDGITRHVAARFRVIVQDTP